jgi:hypothetical protein
LIPPDSWAALIVAEAGIAVGAALIFWLRCSTDERHAIVAWARADLHDDLRAIHGYGAADVALKALETLLLPGLAFRLFCHAVSTLAASPSSFRRGADTDISVKWGVVHQHFQGVPRWSQAMSRLMTLWLAGVCWIMVSPPAPTTLVESIGIGYLTAQWLVLALDAPLWAIRQLSVKRTMTTYGTN